MWMDRSDKPRERLRMTAYKVISTKHSSILHCSITSEYLLRIEMNALEYSLYIPWRDGTSTRLGHFLSA